MLKKDDYEILKLQLNKNLSKSLTYIINVLKKCQSFNKFKNDINKVIYEHHIFKNKKKIQLFSELIMNADILLTEKTLEIQEQSTMRKIRKKELKFINNLIENDYKQLLLNENSKLNNLLPSPEEDAKDEKEDNILVEDTKNINKNKKFLNKKRIKPKENEEKQGHDYTFKNCYICKKRLFLDDIHNFYGSLCQKCGDFNYSFRIMKIDMTGRIAIVTGGRVKIGYYIATKILSYGCKF